ncbi:MAG: LysR family transcriptional regulator [Lachnospiraceae bacterium]
MDTNIQKYLAFLKTVEYGSFTKAAKSLNYSQSGISHMIRDLEVEWKLPLLERSRSGVHITSDGLHLLPFARSVCDEYFKLQTQIDNLHNLDSGLIRIGSFSSPATHWLPNIMKRFQKDYPNIDFEIHLGNYTEIEEWLNSGEIDCGFVLLPSNNAFDTIFLEKDPLLVVIPENHPLAGIKSFPIKALEEDPFLLSKNKDDSEVLALLTHLQVHPKIHFTTWDDYALMSMIESGLGIGILSGLILKRTPYHILAKELSVPAYRDIGFAIRKKENAPIAVTYFLRYLDYRY